MQLFHEPEAQPGMLDTKLLLKHLMDEPRVRCRPDVRGREKNDQFTLPYRDIFITSLANLRGQITRGQISPQFDMSRDISRLFAPDRQAIFESSLVDYGEGDIPEISV